jgi:hypothetical protein
MTTVLPANESDSALAVVAVVGAATVAVVRTAALDAEVDAAAAAGAWSTLAAVP